MTSGELTERVTFLAPTKTTDSLRGQVVSWTTELAEVWAQWRGLTGRELMVAQAMDTIPTYRLTIRYRADITTKLRVRRHDGTICDVASVVDPTGRKEWLELDLVGAV